MSSRRTAITYSQSDKVAPYEEAVRMAGLEPVLSSASEPVRIEDMDALVLTGGSDVNPALYGEAPDPQTEEPENARDAMELRLLREAIVRGIPVLAICRGLQLLNVAQGGTLHQHIEAHVKRTKDKALPAHNVEVVVGTHLARIAGSGPLPVNSRHHQAIAKLGKDLRLSATSEDGVVEGVELTTAEFVVAVQWHPENQVSADRRQLALFQALATAIASGSVHC
jgi:putative glutamine amidotransferase